MLRVKSPKISKFGKCENFSSSEKMYLFLEGKASELQGIPWVRALLGITDEKLHN